MWFKSTSICIAILCTSIIPTYAQDAWEPGCDDSSGVGYRWTVDYGSIMRANLVSSKHRNDDVIFLHCPSNTAFIVRDHPLALRQFDKMAVSKRVYTLDAVERYLRQESNFLRAREVWDDSTCLCSAETRSRAFNMAEAIRPKDLKVSN